MITTHFKQIDPAAFLWIALRCFTVSTEVEVCKFLQISFLGYKVLGTLLKVNAFELLNLQIKTKKFLLMRNFVDLTKQK